MVGVAASALPAHTVDGAGPLADVRTTGQALGAGATKATAAREMDTGTGEPLMHLHTLLHGTDRLMVQALKTDLDLPVTTARRRLRNRCVLG